MAGNNVEAALATAEAAAIVASATRVAPGYVILENMFLIWTNRVLNMIFVTWQHSSPVIL